MPVLSLPDLYDVLRALCARQRPCLLGQEVGKPEGTVRTQVVPWVAMRYQPDRVLQHGPWPGCSSKAARRQRLFSEEQAKQKTLACIVEKENRSYSHPAERSAAVLMSGQCPLFAPVLDLAKSAQEVKRGPKCKCK